MKVFIINRKRFARYFGVSIVGIGLCALLYFAGFTEMLKSVSVFGNNRVLPIYSVETDKNLVSITFDCAWGAGDIPAILEILKKENVRASFFMVGQWGEKFPDAVRLIAQDGHDVANHGYSHLRMSTIGKEKCRSEIELCNQKLGEISGTKVTLFRPPYGDYNNTVIETCNELGCYPIQWNVDSLDWKKEMSRQAILDRILKRTKPGAIILFHNDTQYTVELLPRIISELKAKGLNFAPVSELIMKENYYIDDQGRQQKR
ncbi:peptidoglycan-N-acetylmuramic acid deacetylase PdaA precursor [Ruminiclostridium hungatei]|uniref:Peptidoglycan-N-acetylmuramic acid deacetylase PdaA n=1 Tax=Ruminiclostridium hungatei TaxID=48256 RepID=A0A1V4SL45_RUMHU|nr:polysaccharide deacetylase family protein [Ruminiclostridium hungatei]OPX44205.1 peptidoglycan-N-acetylmuramic acid deacetylase PdaA precursor [Ruminiclostridium hungatei]